MIYFARTPSGPIKIGTSEDVLTRLGQLRYEHGGDLALLAVTPGGRKEESLIHKHFSHLRLGLRELFRPDPALLAFIEEPFLPSAGSVAMLPRAQVRLDPELVRMAKMIAVDERTDVGTLLEELLEGPIARRYQALVKRLGEKEGSK